MTYGGSVTVVAGTPIPLGTGHHPFFTLTVQAVKSDGDNTGNIYLGGRDVSSSAGLILAPGDFFTFPPMETNAYNLEDIWIDGSTSGDELKFIYSTR